MRFGSGDAYSLDGSKAVFTTGISLTMVPASISQNFFEKLLDGIPHYEKNGVFYTNCGIVIRDVYIMFETYWI